MYSHLELCNYSIFLNRYRDIIEDKCTKAFAVNRKQAVWERITNEFNNFAETGTRTMKQLKILYDNMKRESKRALNQQQPTNNSPESAQNKV